MRPHPAHTRCARSPFDTDELIDDIEADADCQDVCEAWQACGNPNFNVDDCEGDCRLINDQSLVFERQVEICTQCVDDAENAGGSCLEDGSFACGDVCAGIVP